MDLALCSEAFSYSDKEIVLPTLLQQATVTYGCDGHVLTHFLYGLNADPNCRYTGGDAGIHTGCGSSSYTCSHLGHFGIASRHTDFILFI